MGIVVRQRIEHHAALTLINWKQGIPSVLLSLYRAPSTQRHDVLPRCALIGKIAHAGCSSAAKVFNEASTQRVNAFPRWSHFQRLMGMVGICLSAPKAHPLDHRESQVKTTRQADFPFSHFSRK